MSRHQAGSIVIVDWRGGALAREPSKLRPAVVVEDAGLFPDDYPNMLVVPLTRDDGLAHQSFAERIEPTVENGAGQTSWALAHHVTSVSLQRIESTDSRIADEHVTRIRSRIAVAVGAG